MHIGETSWDIFTVGVNFKNFNSFTSRALGMANDIYGLGFVMNINSMRLKRNTFWPTLNF